MHMRMIGKISRKWANYNIMSRSYRKNPIAGWASDSDKECKTNNNRSKRANLKSNIKKHIVTNVEIDDVDDLYDLDVDLHVDKSSCDEPYLWSKDGKCAMFSRGKHLIKGMSDEEWKKVREKMMRK